MILESLGKYFFPLLILLLTSCFTTASAAPIVTSPAPSSTLTQSTETFTWDANGTANILEWYLYIGTTGVSSTNIFSGSQGTNTSATVSGLPTDGSTIYFRLWYRTTS